jgi:EAL and modified HD-GYP domain-containing signal transduction protein
MLHGSTAKVPPKPVFLAREPILDRRKRVIGYEVRLRPEAGPATADADRASARVITEGLVGIGLDTVASGQKAFVRIGREMLISGVPAVLPPGKVVIELGTDIEADREVVAACEELRRNGYALAVDDFVLNEWTADLVPLASYLKVDMKASVDPETRARTVACLRPGVTALVAKNVETFEEFESAARDGFTAFQGFFFGRPLLLQGRDVPGQQLALLRVLKALNNPNLSVGQLEELVKHDAALCYRILRTVNSAAFALQTTIKSVREALLLLGRDTVRRWASIWALAGLNADAHSELVVMSTTRARCCELTAGSARGEDAGAEAFLMGMCSLLDAILDRPMPAIVAELPLEDRTKRALCGEANPMRDVLDCVLAYERGAWEECDALARKAKVNPAILPVAYVEALKWSREFQDPPTAH